MPVWEVGDVNDWLAEFHFWYLLQVFAWSSGADRWTRSGCQDWWEKIYASKASQRSLLWGPLGSQYGWISACMNTNTCMMVALEDWSEVKMLPIVVQYICPGTCIITNWWQAYNQLSQLHNVVNHRLNFVDPNDPPMHTNTIEGSWALVKVKFCAIHGTSDALFDSYLQEFLVLCPFRVHLWQPPVLDLLLLLCSSGIPENAKTALFRATKTLNHLWRC